MPRPIGSVHARRRWPGTRMNPTSSGISAIVKTALSSSGPTPRPSRGVPRPRKNTAVASSRAGDGWTCRATTANAMVISQPTKIAGTVAMPGGYVAVRPASRRFAATKATSAISSGPARSNLASSAPRVPPASRSPAMATRCTSKATEATAAITPARSGHRVADQSPTGADHTRLLPSPPGESCTTLGPRAGLLTGQARGRAGGRGRAAVVAMADDRRARQAHGCRAVDRRLPHLDRAAGDLSHPRGRPQRALGRRSDLVVRRRRCGAKESRPSWNPAAIVLSFADATGCDSSALTSAVQAARGHSVLIVTQPGRSGIEAAADHAGATLIDPSRFIGDQLVATSMPCQWWESCTADGTIAVRASRRLADRGRRRPGGPDHRRRASVNVAARQVPQVPDPAGRFRRR